MIVRPPGISYARLGPRRRGPRSHDALVRRSQGRASVSPNSPLVVESDGGNPDDSQPDFQNTCFTHLGFTVLFVNIRSVIYAEKRALLCAQLSEHSPDIVGLTETWLDASVKSLEIIGYIQIPRKSSTKFKRRILEPRRHCPLCQDRWYPRHTSGRF